VSVEIRDVTTGLWLWRQRHHEWREGDDWEPEVSSFAVESGGETVLLDPLAPRPEKRDLWERLAAILPTAIVVLKPDHVRDVDHFAVVRRPGAWPVALLGGRRAEDRARARAAG